MAIPARNAGAEPRPARTVNLTSMATRADGHEATRVPIKQAAASRVGKGVKARALPWGPAVAKASPETARIPNSNLNDTKNCRWWDRTDWCCSETRFHLHKSDLRRRS